MWRVISINWPVVVVAVAAASRAGAPSEIALRFDLTNFPVSAPTATPWDLSTGVALDVAKRPKGGRASTVFRRDGWEQGRALYAAYDRVALAGHANWAQESPQLLWRPGRTLQFFLEQIYDLVNCDAYQGI